jgi:integrase
LFATTILANGGDLKAVSKLLGHASTKMTADTYYHELKGEKVIALSRKPVLTL